MLDIMAENSVDTGGNVSKQRVSSDLCATLYSMLSLKFTDNVLHSGAEVTSHTVRVKWILRHPVYVRKCVCVCNQ